MLGLDLAADDPRIAPYVPAMSRWVAQRVTRQHKLLGRVVGVASGTTIGRRALRRLYNQLNPGIVHHYAFRKKWLEVMSIAAVNAGIDTMLVLAAGLDTLGSRLASQYPSLQVIEVDLETTQEYKRLLLNEIGAIPRNLHLFSFDVSDSQWISKLSAQFPPLGSVLVVAEGLTMYLSKGAVQDLFTGLRDSVQNDLQIAFSFLNVVDSTLDAPQGARRWLKQSGESIKWVISSSALDGWLHGIGFAPLVTLSATDIAKQFDESFAEANPLISRQIEMVCLARKL